MTETRAYSDSCYNFWARQATVRAVQQYGWKPVKVTATAYDACERCCGNTLGITRSGTRVTSKRTLAVDPAMVPLGSLVYIDHPDPKIRGLYRAEDTGGSIKHNRIDIYLPTHSQALKFGVQKLTIYVLNDRNIL